MSNHIEDTIFGSLDFYQNKWLPTLEKVTHISDTVLHYRYEPGWYWIFKELKIFEPDSV